jgi:hypothetical protein
MGCGIGRYGLERRSRVIYNRAAIISGEGFAEVNKVAAIEPQGFEKGKQVG